MGRFGVSYEKQNYVSVLRPSLLSCPFTLATGSKTHSHYEDFKGRAGGQNENHSSSCMRLSLGTGQSSLCWHKAGRQLNYFMHVQRGLPSQTLSTSQRADSKVFGAGMTAGRLLIAIITTALWLVNMIQSRKQTCHRIIGFHHSRA